MYNIYVYITRAQSRDDTVSTSALLALVLLLLSVVTRDVSRREVPRSVGSERRG